MGNYMRNSVKVTVDAYDGTVTFYVADPHEPIVRAYAAAFPGLLKPLDGDAGGPARAHPVSRGSLRHPGAHVRQYHMQDPQVFYNKEDLWAVPRRRPRRRDREMDPYYTIMRLPGEKREEFILLMPFTPAPPGQHDRVAGGALGPAGLRPAGASRVPQAEARLRAAPDRGADRPGPVISQQLTLWSQRGSTVIRGGLLAIPIEESLLYVQPLYLAAEQGAARA